MQLTEVEEPAHEGDFSHVQEVIPFSCSLSGVEHAEQFFIHEGTLTWLHVHNLPLLAHQVHQKHSNRRDQADSAAPPDDGRAKKVVLRLVVSPSAHSQTETKERPVEGLGRKDVFFVGVGNERVVGRHHGHIEMPKVAEERRTVELSVSSRHCK